MHSQVVPNYSDLFKTPTDYKDIVAGLSSESIIITCIAINNELNSIEERYTLQKRIYGELRKTFTPGQKRYIDLAFNKLRVKTNKRFEGLVFAKRYLLEMILKELNNFRYVNEPKSQPQEYAFFKAYLQVTQEVHQHDKSLTAAKLPKGDPNKKYEFLWKPLNQLEFSEEPHITFEIFKLLSFLKFAAITYHKELKQYLNKNNFTSIGMLMASFNQVNNATMYEDSNSILKKLVYVRPKIGVDTQHLVAQTINKQNGIGSFTMRELKEFPLYYCTKRLGYLVIDQSFYYRKNYYGPFFELFYKTTLNLEEGGKKAHDAFNTYSSKVSKALESSLLKSLLTVVYQFSHYDILNFGDDKTKDIPDAYVRIGNTIFLFEYKAYIFREQLTHSPNVSEVKDYIYKKYVNSGIKKKGITQLRDQINILFNGGYQFDQLEKYKQDNNKIRIYPILLHHDFLFSLPGVNDYLQGIFKDIITSNTGFEIMPVTLMNLSIFLDMALGKKDLSYLEDMLMKYFTYLQYHQQKWLNSPTTKNLLHAHISFDELYRIHFSKEIKGNEGTDKVTINRLLELAGISLEDFNNPF
jgi:hypothetical protein